MKQMAVLLVLVFSLIIVVGVNDAWAPTGSGSGKGKSSSQGKGYVTSPGGGDKVPYDQRTQNEACKRFLDETSGLRKDLHNKRFDYSEALRDSGTTSVDLARREQEIKELRINIDGKNPQSCRW